MVLVAKFVDFFDLGDCTEFVKNSNTVQQKILCQDWKFQKFNALPSWETLVLIE